VAFRALGWIPTNEAQNTDRINMVDKSFFINIPPLFNGLLNPFTITMREKAFLLH
jgi:hypothetical protein